MRDQRRHLAELAGTARRGERLWHDADRCSSEGGREEEERPRGHSEQSGGESEHCMTTMDTLVCGSLLVLEASLLIGLRREREADERRRLWRRIWVFAALLVLCVLTALAVP